MRMNASLATSARIDALVEKKETVCLLVDTSGSMAFGMPGGPGTRLDAMCRGVLSILGCSDPRRTEYCLVTFNDVAEIRAPKTSHYLAIQSLKYIADGSTAMAQGINIALTTRADRIILLTDGESTDPEDQVLGAAGRCRSAGVKVDCIAIGEADHKLLRRIAEETGGVFRVASTAEELLKTYCLLETRSYLLLTHGGK